MGVTSCTQEYTSPSAPSRMFKALIVDSKNLIQLLLPEFIKNVNTIQGDGGAGTIEQVNFTEGSSCKHVKHRIDELHEENLVCKYTVIEGDALEDKVESISYDVRFEAASDGSCTCKMTSNYRIIDEFRSRKRKLRLARKEYWGYTRWWRAIC